ncbi:MAG TPA: sigma-70 family RNA polymerase sigma factor [Acidobacteriota bacterium]|nr:sigma-70 family RNA polymerase sigma factor [Acidobacteriota bacterium]
MEDALNSTLSTENPKEANLAAGIQETAWIGASQKGDTLAFNRLVLKWEKSIYNLALRMLQDPEDAAEVTQEVFLSAFKSIHRFRYDARFSTWLYRIAANHCMTRLRQRPHGIHHSIDDENCRISISHNLPIRDSHEGEFLRDEVRTRVRSALEHLHPEQKIVVELKFFQELTFDEIAKIMQAPVSTIKSRFYSGLDLLKVRLGRSHGVDPTPVVSRHPKDIPLGRPQKEPWEKPESISEDEK